MSYDVAIVGGGVIGCAIAAAISAALALIGFIGLIALGLLMDEGRIPNSAAVPGRELTATTLDFLHSEGLLGEDERILFFYADGFLSVRADGNFFTDRRAVSYWENDDEIRFEAVTLERVHAAGASKVRLNFIQNEQDVVFTTEVLQQLQVFLRRMITSAAAKVGFRNQAADRMFGNPASPARL